MQVYTEYFMQKERKGQSDEAEAKLIEAYKGRTSKLGPEHPHTLDSLKNLIELCEAWDKDRRRNKCCIYR